MKKTLASTAIIVLGIALGTAFADKQATIQRLREDVKIQDARAKELENVAKWDDEAAKALHRHAADSRKHAEWVNNRSKDYSASAALLPDGDPGKKELLSFANELNVFAKHDNDFANQRENLAKSLEGQAKAAWEGAKNHQESVNHFNDVISHLEQH